MAKIKITPALTQEKILLMVLDINIESIENILLDNQIKEYPGDESPPHANCLYVQEDGSYFFNYLSAAAQGDIIEHEKILLHKTLIEQEIIKNKSNPSVLSKYTWLAGYHNYFCELNSHLPGYSDDLIIQNYPSKYGNLLRK